MQINNKIGWGIRIIFSWMIFSLHACCNDKEENEVIPICIASNHSLMAIPSSSSKASSIVCVSFCFKSGVIKHTSFYLFYSDTPGFYCSITYLNQKRLT